jgi:hypothetical protein
MTKQSITFKRSAAALAVVAGLLAAAAPAARNGRVTIFPRTRRAS